MSEDNSSPVSSRREFLKKACKTTGYVIPLVMVLKLGSANAWAQSYGRTTQNTASGSGKTHDGFFDQIGRFFANLFHS
jgi:hypothetical protein